MGLFIKGVFWYNKHHDILVCLLSIGVRVLNVINSYVPANFTRTIDVAGDINLLCIGAPSRGCICSVKKDDALGCTTA